MPSSVRDKTSLLKKGIKIRGWLGLHLGVAASSFLCIRQTLRANRWTGKMLGLKQEAASPLTCLPVTLLKVCTNSKGLSTSPAIGITSPSRTRAGNKFTVLSRRAAHPCVIRYGWIYLSCAMYSCTIVFLSRNTLWAPYRA